MRNYDISYWWGDASVYSVPYDGRSLMHYGPKAGAKPEYEGQYTMISKVSWIKKIFYFINFAILNLVF